MTDTSKKNYIQNNTDVYFSSTKKIAQKHGDIKVVYAIFLRKPSIYACALAINWLKEMALTYKSPIRIYENFNEGELVGAGAPLFFVEGYFSFLSELETLLLQKVGPTCICAWHAYIMSRTLPKVEFISMVARHCCNPDMVFFLEYGVAVGSTLAQKEGNCGFIGCSTKASSKLFNAPHAIGTMPHSLVGYAGSTLKAAQLYYDTFKPIKMTVLVDYFGKEITDTLEVCNYFKDFAFAGNLSIRLDTHGGRFLEGLDYDSSHTVVEKYVEDIFHGYQDKAEINSLIGPGVSAAALFYLRECLDKNGFTNVKITASSGFNLKKCNLMSKVKAPINVIGTGSFIPEKWSDTYATADIISYNGKLLVKKGREFLIKKWRSQIIN
ncbi:Nicotinate phosphoribosyltransferase [Candidatus Hepatincolaceae symbiont of Richtersius coronifer]